MRCKDFCMLPLLWTTYLSGIRNNIFLYTCAIDSLCVLCLRIPTTRTGFSTFVILPMSVNMQPSRDLEMHIIVLYFNPIVV